MPSTIVILATGGTIAGTAASAADALGYTAAQRGVADLLASVPALQGQVLEAEQVAQLDSKDMDAATWLRLAQRAAHHLARPEVAGLVVTHGTDTLEETAWFLHRVLGPAKPLVLTGAMRPATHLHADGPQNLLDAVSLARHPLARGVLVVFAGAVHGAADVRKVHAHRLDAFSSGDAGVLGHRIGGPWRSYRAWPDQPGLGLTLLPLDVAQWPAVAVLHLHVGLRAEWVDALCASGLRGLVLACTGNGSIPTALEPALARVQAAGVQVWRCTRCAQGMVLAAPGKSTLPAVELSPWQARVEMMLGLMTS